MLTPVEIDNLIADKRILFKISKPMAKYNLLLELETLEAIKISMLVPDFTENKLHKEHDNLQVLLGVYNDTFTNLLEINKEAANDYHKEHQLDKMFIQSEMLKTVLQL